MPERCGEGKEGLDVAGFEGRNKLWNQEMWASSGRRKRHKSEVSPWASRKEWSPGVALILAQWGPFWTSEFQNGKIITLFWL